MILNSAAFASLVLLHVIERHDRAPKPETDELMPAAACRAPESSSCE